MKRADGAKTVLSLPTLLFSVFFRKQRNTMDVVSYHLKVIVVVSNHRK